MGKSTTNDMTVGSPVKLIIQFMIPMCLGNIFQQFYNIADSIIAGRLNQIFTNILSNSIKFTPRGASPYRGICVGAIKSGWNQVNSIVAILGGLV